MCFPNLLSNLGKFQYRDLFSSIWEFSKKIKTWENHTFYSCADIIVGVIPSPLPPTSITHLAKAWQHFIVTIKGVTLNTSMGRYHFRPLQKYHDIFATFFSETIIPWILWIRTSNAEQLKQKDNADRNDVYNIIIHCFYARFFITRRNK